MTDDQTIQLTLPNKMEYLPLVLDAVTGLGRIMGFGEEDILALEVAVEEAVTNVIKYAFRKDEEATFDVVLNPGTLGLQVIIRDKGYPFDPSMIPEYSPDKVKEDPEYKGLGTFLMKSLPDEMSFHNLGKDGREQRFFKYLGDHISQHPQEIKKSGPSVAPSTSQDIRYTVRRMKPEEAIEVSRLAYSAYGYTYINEDVYFPERLRELNRTKDFISFVAITDDGKIIAHNAFERRDDRDIPELGVAFTNPEYRGHGCLNSLTTALLEEAEKQGFTGIFSQGITTHPFSQKTLIKFGFRDCALMLSKGKEREYKGIEQKKVQRESTVLFIRYVRMPQKFVIYPPARHMEMILNLYENSGFVPQIKSPEAFGEPETGRSALSVTTSPSSLTAEIIINQYGKDILMQVHNHLRDLCINRTETIMLRMILNDPFTAIYTPDFEKLGFFFCGIRPRSGGNDELMLQYLNNYRIDYSQLQIASDKGKELLEYIIRNSETFSL